MYTQNGNYGARPKPQSTLDILKERKIENNKMADLKRYINPPSEQEKARGRKQTRNGIFTGIATLFASGGLFAFLDYKVTDGEYTAQIKSAIMSLIDDIRSLWQYNFKLHSVVIY